MDRLQTLLESRFGHAEFQPGQREVVEALMSGRDCLAIMPTGAGKSLTYQLTGLALGGLTVVVSPLIALMKDQTEALAEIGVAAAEINSTHSRRENAEGLAGITSGTDKFVYVTPERLADTQFLEALKAARVSLFVVDEAHLISEWGHDFRPAYLLLKRAIDALGRPPVLALTATATPVVRDDITANLGLKDPLVVVRGFDRPNLYLDVAMMRDEEHKLSALREMLGCARHKRNGNGSANGASNGHDKEAFFQSGETPLRLTGPGIIYVSTIRALEKVSQHLCDRGCHVAVYHGRLRKSERDATHDAFMANEVDVVVATSAFGLGIDKRDIRFIVHYDMPGSIEQYYQEIGRAGRDGEPATCVLLYHPADRRVQNFFIQTGTPSETRVRQVWAVIEDMANQRDRDLLELADIDEELKLKRGELGILLAPLIDSGYLARYGEKRVRRLGRGISPADLNLDLRRYERHKTFEQSRLQMMEAYVHSHDCRREFILNYFGEHYDTDNCGQCDNCIAGRSYLNSQGNSSFAPGAVVKHAQWGRGTVQRLDGDAMTVMFENEGYKQLSVAIVTQNQLLALA